MQAYIADYVELSNLDIVSKVCDVIYFAGCDYNCPSCNVSEMLNFKEEFIVDLREIKNKMKANSSGKDAILFTGGEPCLQRQALLELSKYAKNIGLKVILHTNGSKPDCVNSMLRNKLLDKIIIDIKAPFQLEIYEKVTKSHTFFKTTDNILQDLRQTLALVEDSDIEVEFKTLIIPSLIYRKEDLLEIAKEIAGLEAIWTLTKFIPNNCLADKFNAINSPSDSFMKNLKEFLLSEMPNLKIVIE